MVVFCHCGNQNCKGVLEFVGTLNNESGFAPERKYTEETVMKQQEEVLMVYKCSRCNKIEFRANERLSMEMSKMPVGIPLP